MSAPGSSKGAPPAPRSRNSSVTRRDSLSVNSKGSSCPHDDCDTSDVHNTAASSTLAAESQDTTPRSARGASELQLQPAAEQPSAAHALEASAPALTTNAPRQASSSSGVPDAPGSPGVAEGLARRAERTASAGRRHAHHADDALHFRDRQLSCAFAAALRPDSPVAQRMRRRSSGVPAPSALSRSHSASLSQSNLPALEGSEHGASSEAAAAPYHASDAASAAAARPPHRRGLSGDAGSFAAAVRGAHLERAHARAADFAVGVAGPPLGTGPRLGVRRSSSRGRVAPRRIRRTTQVRFLSAAAVQSGVVAHRALHRCISGLSSPSHIPQCCSHQGGA